MLRPCLLIRTLALILAAAGVTRAVHAGPVPWSYQWEALGPVYRPDDPVRLQDPTQGNYVPGWGGLDGGDRLISTNPIRPSGIRPKVLRLSSPPNSTPVAATPTAVVGLASTAGTPGITR
jgi:hypothetical protein